MRTKLDEIVEEEIAEARRVYWTASDVVETLGKRIAERAFRHGVEQGAHAAIHATKFIDAVNPEEFSYRVQPEPVGENEHVHRGYKCIHQNPADGSEIVYYLRVGGGRTYFQDGRRGKRRKVTANGAFRHSVVTAGRIQMYFDVTGENRYLWKDDRRIKDRRKA